MRKKSVNFFIKILKLCFVIPITFSVGCAQMKYIAVPGLPYRFPRQEVVDLIMPNDGKTLVRIKPSGMKFMLVYDELTNIAQKRTDEILVSKINTNYFFKAEKLVVKDKIIFCNNSLHYSCGYKIYDGGVAWSVIFDRIYIDELISIDEGAKTSLLNYRSSK